MKKKTLMVGLLAMLLVLALAGCGGGNQSNRSNPRGNDKRSNSPVQFSSMRRGK